MTAAVDAGAVHRLRLGSTVAVPRTLRPLAGLGALTLAFSLLGACGGSEQIGAGAPSRSGDTTNAGTFVDEHQYIRESDRDLAAAPGAATWTATAWRAERLHAPLVVWAADGTPANAFEWRMSDLEGAAGRAIPKEQVRILFPSYVTADPERRGCGGYGSREDAASVRLADALAAEPGRAGPPDDPLAVWLAIDVPPDACPGDYRGTFTVRSATAAPARFAVELKVLPLALPAPAEWRFALDLWQHPTAVLDRYNDAHPEAAAQPWSEAHYGLLEAAYRMLADTGQKALTATLKDGALGAPGMVRWIREGAGAWRFDFSVFGAHVERLAGWGISGRIDAYGIVGWNRDRIPYFDEATQAAESLHAPVGSTAHATAWQAFLPAFRTYLQDRGWFGKTHLAVDESVSGLGRIIDLVRADDAGWKIAVSYFGDPPEGLERVDAVNVFLRDAAAGLERAVAASAKTLYTSCAYVASRPITRINFLLTPDSSPADIEWLTWYAEKLGANGLSRWAYDYWRVADPLDARNGLPHTSGDGALIYRSSNDADLEPVTSVRLETLRRGIQDFEKRRVLRALYEARGHAAAAASVDALLTDAYISAQSARAGRSADDLARARRRLDAVSADASALLGAEARCR